MNERELAEAGKSREIERNKEMLRTEFSASLHNATPEQQRWIEIQIGKAAINRYYYDEDQRVKCGVSLR